MADLFRDHEYPLGVCDGCSRLQIVRRISDSWLCGRCTHRVTSRGHDERFKEVEKWSKPA